MNIDKEALKKKAVNIGKKSAGIAKSSAVKTAVAVKKGVEDAREKAKERQELAVSGKCPKCHGEKIELVQQTKTKGMSLTGSAGGCCCFGPIGILCGLPGMGQQTTDTCRMCMNCGKKF